MIVQKVYFITQPYPFEFYIQSSRLESNNGSYESGTFIFYFLNDNHPTAFF